MAICATADPEADVEVVGLRGRTSDVVAEVWPGKLVLITDVGGDE